MGVFDCVKEIITIVKDGKQIKCTKEYYPFTDDTYYVLKCPKYLSSALVSRYGYKYGVSVYDNNHISLTNEDGIVEVYGEIKKGQNLYDTHHSGQKVSQISYDGNYNFSIVFVKGNFDEYDRFMVNHEQKRVSAIHGYPGAGKDYAKVKNYTYVDVHK